MINLYYYDVWKKKITHINNYIKGVCVEHSCLQYSISYHCLSYRHSHQKYGTCPMMYYEKLFTTHNPLCKPRIYRIGKNNWPQDYKCLNKRKFICY